MIKLTEEMVIARTRISDLSNVKKLNCWGADLQDVSLLRKMPNVEVLALSVNQICSLADFQNCCQLQELYIRKNNIKDLRDICYLKSLTHLKNLWLADNPCSQEEGYRLTVIRTLPQLEKLDDVPVKPDEVEEAGRKGRDLVLPMKDEENLEYQDQVVINSQDTLLQDASPNKESSLKKSNDIASVSPIHSLKSSPIAPSPDYLENNHSPLVPEELSTTQSTHDDSPLRRYSVIGSGAPSGPVHQEKVTYSESAPVSRRSSVAASSFTSGSEHSSFNTSSFNNEQSSPSKCPIHQNAFTPLQTAPATAALPQSMSASQSDLHNAMSSSNLNDSRNSYIEQRPYRLIQDLPQSRHSPSHYQPSTGYPLQNPATPNYGAPGINTERCSPTRGGRVRNRASNLLMAALCLVNELDYGSLEVLGMAVRNRLDEFDSN